MAWHPFSNHDDHDIWTEAALGDEALSAVPKGVHEAVAAGETRQDPHGGEVIRLRSLSEGIQPKDDAANAHGQAQASS